MAKNPKISAASRGQSFQSPNALINMILANPEEAKKAAYLGASFAPGTGEAISAKESVEDFSKGNIAMGTLGALGAIPLVGSAARFVKKGVKGAEEAKKLVSRQLSDDWAYNRVDEIVRSNSYPDGRSKAIVAQVDPKEFINATAPNPSKIAKESSKLNVDKMIDETAPIYITMKDGIITGHEGRHRMQALADAGIQDIPIVIKSIDSPMSSAKPITLAGQNFGSHGKAKGNLTLIDPVLATSSNRERLERLGQFNIKEKPRKKR